MSRNHPKSAVLCEQKMWKVNAKIRNEREMGRAVEKEKRMCQNAHLGFTLIVSLNSEHFARFVFKNKLIAFNESIHEH